MTARRVRLELNRDGQSIYGMGSESNGYFSMEPWHSLEQSRAALDDNYKHCAVREVRDAE